MSSPSSEGSSPNRPAVWAVAGGKGGVGKSVLSVNLAVSAAMAGRRVTLVDGDLGGANLDTLLGCQRPSLTMGHFFSKEVPRLQDVATPTAVEGLVLVAGDGKTLGSANPHHAQKLKLIRHLRRLPCDLVILDLGAGTSFNTLDLYLAADLEVVVTTPEPTAVQNCFAFIKAVSLRDLERTTRTKRRSLDRGSIRHLGGEGPAARKALSRITRLVVNRATEAEGRQIANSMDDLVRRFVGGSAQLAGVVHDDPAVAQSVRRMTPLCSWLPDTAAARDMRSLGESLLAPAASVSRGRGVNEEIILAGRRLHIQTEDLGEAHAAVVTQVFSGDGQVVYSRRTPYVDAFFARLRVGPRDRVRFHHVAIRKAIVQGRIRVERAA